MWLGLLLWWLFSLFLSFVICLGCDHSLTLHHLFILTSHYAAWHYIYRHCHGSGSQHSEFLLFLWHFVLWFPEFILLAFVQYVFMCVSLCALFPSSVPVFPSLCVIPYFLHLLCLSVFLDLLVSLSVVSSQSPCHVWILCRPLCLVSLVSSLSLSLSCSLLSAPVWCFYISCFIVKVSYFHVLCV